MKHDKEMIKETRISSYKSLHQERSKNELTASREKVKAPVCSKFFFAVHLAQAFKPKICTSFINSISHVIVTYLVLNYKRFYQHCRA